MLLVVFAILFLVALYLSKNGFTWSNKSAYESGNGLLYENASIEDLVKKDSDGDGVLDWEEGLWGLDPTKQETTPGTPDITVINKLRAEGSGEQGGSSLNYSGEENLTETDKFSRELFSTVATLTQTGAMDQATVDKISNSLNTQLQNSLPRKIYTLTDIKVINNNSVQVIKNYNDTLENIHLKYPINGSVAEVLQKFIVDENSVDTSVLAELDLIIKPTQGIIDETIKMSVPQSLVPLHLDFINGLERFVENLNDIKLYDTDAIVALGAISQYDQNITLLESAVIKLRNAIEQKLEN